MGGWERLPPTDQNFAFLPHQLDFPSPLSHFSLPTICRLRKNDFFKFHLTLGSCIILQQSKQTKANFNITSVAIDWNWIRVMISNKRSIWSPPKCPTPLSHYNQAFRPHYSRLKMVACCPPPKLVKGNQL